MLRNKCKRVIINLKRLGERRRREFTDVNLYLDINETGEKGNVVSHEARRCTGAEHTANFVRPVIYEPIQIVHTRFVRKVRLAEILKRESS